jgi:hypothetical protein
LQNITLAKFRAWMKAESLDSPTSKIRPQRGFVAQIGSTRW